jgi:hypothetical protein
MHSAGKESGSRKRVSYLAEWFRGGAHWLADGVDLETYLSEGFVGKDVSAIENKCRFAHHIL